MNSTHSNHNQIQIEQNNSFMGNNNSNVNLNELSELTDDGEIILNTYFNFH